MNQAIQDALTQAITYPEYVALMERLADTGATSGPEQTESLVHYTHLNNARMRRLNKTAKVGEELAEQLSRGGAQTWLVITESWCGDAAQILPYLDLMARARPNTALRLVMRDEHPELMDQFLTDGSRSIPVVIFLDEGRDVLGHWAPRPAEAQSMVLARKASADPEPYDTFQIKLQKWYLKDKGRATVAEVMARWNEVTP